jgi:hypothetical protein
MFVKETSYEQIYHLVRRPRRSQGQHRHRRVRGGPRRQGRTPGQRRWRVEAVTKALRRRVSRGARLHVVYEAGPCGFVLQRHLAALGWRCEVIAPSSISRPPGERVKTDRRDAMKLARLASLGELKAVRVPSRADEALRDVVRAREDAVREQRNATPAQGAAAAKRHRLPLTLPRFSVPSKLSTSR